jgi:hypothetical protein
MNNTKQTRQPEVLAPVHTMRFHRDARFIIEVRSNML